MPISPRLKNTPSGAFGSCRFKLKSLEENKREYERFNRGVLKHMTLDTFFTMVAATQLIPATRFRNYLKRWGSRYRLFISPKQSTMISQLPTTALASDQSQNTLPFRPWKLLLMFVLWRKLRPRFFILEVMGRHAGWIAAAGGLIEDYDIPVLLLLPEVEFEHDKFIAAVEAKVKQHGYCTVVVSEGAHYADGRFLAEQGTRDSFGHAQLGGAAPIVADMVKQALGYKFHWAVADYLQRAARHLASATDVEQAYAVGQRGVEMALDGQNAVMPTIDRKSTSPYQWEIGSAALSDVANVEKNDAARFYHRRWHGHYPKMPGLFIPPDSG